MYMVIYNKKQGQAVLEGGLQNELITYTKVIQVSEIQILPIPSFTCCSCRGKWFCFETKKKPGHPGRNQNTQFRVQDCCLRILSNAGLVPDDLCDEAKISSRETQEILQQLQLGDAFRCLLVKAVKTALQPRTLPLKVVFLISTFRQK